MNASRCAWSLTLVFFFAADCINLVSVAGRPIDKDEV